MRPHIFFFVLATTLICSSLQCTAATLGRDDSRTVTFLATADLQGQLEPSSSKNGTHPSKVVGGISRIASLIKQIKAESSHPVVVLTAGDDLMGRYFNHFAGKAITKLLDTAGYNIFALGNHEFDSGPGILSEALEEAHFSILCSDLNIKNSALAGTCKQSLIKQYGDIRIGYFSLMTPEFPYVTNGGDVSLNGSTFQVAQKMVTTLKQQNVDIVVAVTHIGIDLDRKLAATTKGIDIIIGGHSHDYPEATGNINNTLIVNGGEKGQLWCDWMCLLTAPKSCYQILPATLLSRYWNQSRKIPSQQNS